MVELPRTDRWFRATPDSSVLDRPRLLARSLIDVADLDAHIAFYERLLGAQADLRMPIPDFGGLELAAVGDLLLIASARPFTDVQRQTRYSLIVSSLTDGLALAASLGATVLEPPEAIVPGSRARVRLPDGVVAELVEHRPRPGERPVGAPSAPGARMRLLVRKVVPHASLDDAVRLYEAFLETKADSALAGSGGEKLAVVGNLLLVGSDNLRDDIRVAVIGPQAEQAGLLNGTGPRESTLDGRTVVALLGGLSAECWDHARLRAS